jgi:hypothetical protein
MTIGFAGLGPITAEQCASLIDQLTNAGRYREPVMMRRDLNEQEVLVRLGPLAATDPIVHAVLRAHHRDMPLAEALVTAIEHLSAARKHAEQIAVLYVNCSLSPSVFPMVPEAASK